MPSCALKQDKDLLNMSFYDVSCALKQDKDLLKMSFYDVSQDQFKLELFYNLNC